MPRRLPTLIHRVFILVDFRTVKPPMASRAYFSWASEGKIY